MPSVRGGQMRLRAAKTRPCAVRTGQKADVAGHRSRWVRNGRDVRHRPEAFGSVGEVWDVHARMLAQEFLKGKCSHSPGCAGDGPLCFWEGGPFGWTKGGVRRAEPPSHPSPADWGRGQRRHPEPPLDSGPSPECLVGYRLPVTIGKVSLRERGLEWRNAVPCAGILLLGGQRIT